MPKPLILTTSSSSPPSLAENKDLVRRKLISLDTETTGIDFHHGAKPFLVTTCDLENNQLWWEWDVNPITREPAITSQDLDEIKHEIITAETIALHNAKFDVTALNAIDTWFGDNWPWEKTYCTLTAGHLIASNQPHDLTSMALVYCNVNIQRYEDDLQSALDKARRYCRSKLKTWAIAKKDRDDMPSAKEKTWKFDLWLLKALATVNPQEWGNYSHLCHTYANADSAVTAHLFDAVQKIIYKRELWPIYQEMMNRLPVVYEMEQRGLPLSGSRLRKMREEFSSQVDVSRSVCVNIAKNDYNYDLDLPKGSKNNSLTHFCFGKVDEETGERQQWLNLPVVQTTDSGAPALNKGVIEHYLLTLDGRSKQASFVRNLAAIRKRSTAIGYMNSYERFMLPYFDVDSLPDFESTGLQDAAELEDWYVLHPSLNPTGTDTLRDSSSNPNEQNISKQEGFNLRYIFGPPPGREWWSCDAKNIELRLPAYDSGEQELINLFERPDDPPYYGSTHLLNFHTVYPDIWEEAIAELRILYPSEDPLLRVGPYCKKKYASTYYQWCKNGGFAVQYGAVDREDGTGTADIAFHRPGSHKLLKSRFNKLEKLNRWCIAQANKYGYVETIPDKAISPERGYPLLCTRSKYGAVKPTVPLNYRIQGSAMWWMRRAMIKVHRFFKTLNVGIPKGQGYYIIAQVHDEMLFDFPSGASYNKEEPWAMNLPIIRKTQKLMESCGDDIGIPTPVSCEYHQETWAEGKTL